MINLVIPREEAQDRLEDRVKKGKEFLNRSISSAQELDQVEDSFHAWSEYNARLLERIFSDDSEANNYRASLSPSVGLPLAQQIEFFYMGVSSRIQKLESYLEQLELIPVADNARPLHGSSSEESRGHRPPSQSFSLEEPRKKVLRRVHERWQASQNYQLSLEYHDIADNSQEGKEFMSLVNEGYIDAELKGLSKTSKTFAFAVVRGLTREGKQELSKDTRVAPREVSADQPTGVTIPFSIHESLQHFREDRPDPTQVAFILMQFSAGPPHDNIARAIRTELDKHGITGLRADDKQYHDDLFANVQTYMHGCGLGIAVFEQVEQEAFNPNVALEVGYMYALGKPVCLLKERNLDSLNADLVGKLYHEFNAYDPEATITPELSKWLSDRRR